MAMAELKTKATAASVSDFVNAIPEETKKEDTKRLLEIFSEETGDSPKMWGTSIIGFGSTLLKYPSGRELEWMKVGFSPRKPAFSLYLMNDWSNKKNMEILSRLGKFTMGKGCVYVKKLADIDESILRKLISISVKTTQ